MSEIFAEKMGDGDCEVGCTAWTTKMPKAAQPNLNYMGLRKHNNFKMKLSISISAPEIQHKSSCTSGSDMYSMGMVFIACFNSGHSIIQASHSTQHYFKLAGQVHFVSI